MADKKISELSVHDMSSDSAYDALVGVTEVEEDGEKKLKTVRVPMQEIIHKEGQEHVPGTTAFETVKVGAIGITNKYNTAEDSPHYIYCDDDGKLQVDINRATPNPNQVLMYDGESVVWGDVTGNGVANLITPITYAELKALRDNKQLVAGMFYRITDYQCTTSQAETRAMNNRFDIIVQALSNCTLSENAKADYNAEDTYFNKVADSNALKPDAVQVYYRIFEDEVDIDGNMGASTYLVHSDDKFVEYGYVERDGETTLAIYKTNEQLIDETDYNDAFYYMGQRTVEGVVYDEWQKTENGEPTIEIEGMVRDYFQKCCILTNVIVEDNKIIDSVKAGTEYVANIPAWEIKYCLDNDTTRFAWALDGQAITNLNSAFSNGQPLVRQPIKDRSVADGGVVEGYLYAWGTQADVDDDDDSDFVWSKNPTLVNGETVYNACADGGNGEYQTAEVVEGKGVIYYMKDEHGNECPYDFKNIQFKRNISLENGYPELDNENGEETWVYTFCGNSYHIDNDEWSELQDGSLESPYGHMNDESSTTFVHNTIKPYTMVVDYENEDRRVCGKQHLNNIVFLGWWERLNSTTDEFAYYYAYCCCFNTFGYNCRNNTLGCHTNYNTFGNGCFENYIGSSSWCNFGHYYNWENFSNGTGESFSYGHKLSSVYEHRLKIDTKNSRVTIDNVVYGFHFYTTLYKKDEFARDIVNYFPNSCKMNVSGYVTINPTGSKDIAMPIFEVQRYNDFFHISFIQEGKYNSITVYVSNLELTVETNAIT